MLCPLIVAITLQWMHKSVLLQADLMAVGSFGLQSDFRLTCILQTQDSAVGFGEHKLYLKHIMMSPGCNNMDKMLCILNYAGCSKWR